MVPNNFRISMLQDCRKFQILNISTSTEWYLLKCLHHPSTAWSRGWERSRRNLRSMICMNSWIRSSTLSLVETLDTPRGHIPGDDIACWCHLRWRGPMECVPCVTKNEQVGVQKVLNPGDTCTHMVPLPHGIQCVTNRTDDPPSFL